MERTYFRNNKVIKSPAHEGGNPQEGDYLRIYRPSGQVKWYTVRVEPSWSAIPDSLVPKEIQVLILLGVA